MKLLASIGKLTAEDGPDIENTRGAVGFGTRVGRERVKIDIVYQASRYVEENLIKPEQTLGFSSYLTYQNDEGSDGRNTYVEGGWILDIKSRYHNAPSKQRQRRFPSTLVGPVEKLKAVRSYFLITGNSREDLGLYILNYPFSNSASRIWCAAFRVPRIICKTLRKV